MVEAVDVTQTVAGVKCQHGDVLIAQPRLSPAEAAACEFPTAVAYLQRLHSLRRISFRRLADPAAAPVLLEVPRDADYATVTRRLADAIGLRRASSAFPRLPSLLLRARAVGAAQELPREAAVRGVRLRVAKGADPSLRAVTRTSCA